MSDRDTLNVALILLWVSIATLLLTMIIILFFWKKLSTRFWRCLGMDVKEKKPETRRLQYGMMAAGGIFPVPHQLNLHPWFRSYHDKRRMAIPVPIPVGADVEAGSGAQNLPKQWPVPKEQYKIRVSRYEPVVKALVVDETEEEDYMLVKQQAAAESQERLTSLAKTEGAVNETKLEPVPDNQTPQNATPELGAYVKVRLRKSKVPSIASDKQSKPGKQSIAPNTTPRTSGVYPLAKVHPASHRPSAPTPTEMGKHNTTTVEEISILPPQTPAFSRVSAAAAAAQERNSSINNNSQPTTLNYFTMV